MRADETGRKRLGNRCPSQPWWFHRRAHGSNRALVDQSFEVVTKVMHKWGARLRWSLAYQRASDQGLDSELKLRIQSLCGWRRMRAAAPADRRISFRQVPLMRQLADEHDNRTRNKNCRRSCQTRRGRALRHWVHRAGEDRALKKAGKKAESAGRRGRQQLVKKISALELAGRHVSTAPSIATRSTSVYQRLLCRLSLRSTPVYARLHRRQ